MNDGLGIWHYVKNYKFNSIFIKNFIIILLLIVLPLTGISVLVYNYYYGVMKEEIGAANMNSLSRVRDMVDMISLEVDKLAVRISSDTDVEMFLGNKPETRGSIDFGTIELIQKINKTLNTSTITSDYIDSIFIYSQNKDYIITSTRGNGELWKFPDRKWHTRYEENRGSSSFWVEALSFDDIAGENKTFNFISTFRLAPLYKLTKSGVVVVNMDSDKLGQLINNTLTKGVETLFVVNSNNTVLYNTDRTLINKKIEDIAFFEGLALEGYGRHIVRKKGDTREVVSYIRSEYNGWKFISVMPLQQFEVKLNHLREYMSLFIMVDIFIALLVSFAISVRVFVPIKKLIGIVEDPENWRAGREKRTLKKNELLYIASNITRSFDKNKQMEEELAVRMNLLKKATSIALQSQINPHFLFNTMENIKWKVMALTGGPNEGAEMIGALSHLLRISLETKDNLVSVSKEIEHATLYIGIQKLRYEDKFEVEWDIDDKVLPYKMVKITLQPIIENAIYHGIKPKEGSGTIKVTAKELDSYVEFTIADDGVGMSPGQVVEINQDLNQEYIKENEHIGMKNVNQRIKLCFGEEYGVTVEGKEGAGTKVKIVIPKVQ